MMIAQNIDEFMEKVTQAEITTLNTPIGQELTGKLLEMKLAQNPDMTPEEWTQTKSEFMVYCFAMLMKEKPEAMQEFGYHMWNRLREQN